MDHVNAHLYEINIDPMRPTLISSAFSHEEKTASLDKSENLMHNKEQHSQSAYYKKLGETIRHYNDVLLFGPTEAKVELANILKDDHQFEKITIAVKQTDKMTANQEQAFVRDYFSIR